MFLTPNLKNPHAKTNLILDTLSYAKQTWDHLYRRATSVIPTREDDLFFIKYQSDKRYEKSQDWKTTIRVTIRNINREIKKNNFQQAFELFEEMLELKIISPIYFEQCLRSLLYQAKQNTKLPSDYINAVRKARARLFFFLKSNRSIAEEYFYQDTLIAIIELSGNQISINNFFKSFDYYQNLIDKEKYDQVTQILFNFINNYSDNITKVNENLYVQDHLLESAYERLLQSIEKIFNNNKASIIETNDSSSKKDFSEKIIDGIQYVIEHPGVLFTAGVAATSIFTCYNYSNNKSSFFSNNIWLNIQLPVDVLNSLAVSYSYHQLFPASHLPMWVLLSSTSFSSLQFTSAQTNDQGFGAQFNLSSLNGVNGFTLNTSTFLYDEPIEIGYSLSSGDINNDGISDLIIGAGPDYTGPGPSYLNISSIITYILFGHTGNFSSYFDLSQLNGTNGFAISATESYPYDEDAHVIATYLYRVNSCDVNGDGIADVVTGYESVNVLFGHSGIFPAIFDSSLLNGTNGFKITGVYPQGAGSYAISCADINNDFIQDIIMGSSINDTWLSPASLTYVLYGQKSSFPAVFNISSLDGSNGFVINPATENDLLGYTVSHGDINADGIQDIILGAAFAGETTVDSPPGATYVIFGRDETFPAVFSVTSLNGTNGFSIIGVEGEYLGACVASGDINGDAIQDVIVGAPYSSNDNEIDNGATYVLFGHSGNFSSLFDITLVDGINGFEIDGEIDDESIGASLGSGDINGDGIDDIFISQLTNGYSYVVYGQKKILNPVLLLTLNGVNGFVINDPPDFMIITPQAYTSGDINGDGVTDLMIGNGGFYTNSSYYTGIVYVIFGQKSTPSHSSSNDSFFQKHVTLLVTIAASSCVVIGLGSAAFFLYKRRKQNLQPKPVDELEEKPLLQPVRFDKGNTIIKHRYALKNQVAESEAEELFKQAGIKIFFTGEKKKIRFLLDKGQFGKLRLAKDLETNKFIGLKKIKGEQEILASKQEAILQKEVTGLPNIMPLLDVVEITDSDVPVLYYFMPLAGFGNGAHFQACLAQITDLNLKEKLFLHATHQFITGVFQLHQHHIYHLDLKPTNVVLNNKGELYVIDFGCAVKLEQDNWMQQGNGDSRYYSPERLAHLRNSETKIIFDASAADAWALGVSLLEMCLNRYPFDEKVGIAYRIANWDEQYFDHCLKEITSLQNPSTDSVFSLIKELLEIDVNKRLSVNDALNHSAFKQLVTPKEWTKLFVHLKQVNMHIMKEFADQLKNEKLQSQNDEELAKHYLFTNENYNNQQDSKFTFNIHRSPKRRHTLFGQSVVQASSQVNDNYNNQPVYSQQLDFRQGATSVNNRSVHGVREDYEPSGNIAENSIAKSIDNDYLARFVTSNTSSFSQRQARDAFFSLTSPDSRLTTPANNSNQSNYNNELMEQQQFN